MNSLADKSFVQGLNDWTDTVCTSETAQGTVKSFYLHAYYKMQG